MTYKDTVAPHPARSWLAHMSAGLGILSLMGVLCFHFPDLLTSKEFRAVYTETLARNLLLTGLIAAFVMGTIAILRNRNRRIALTGVITAALAVLAGGVTVHFDTIESTPYSLGLDNIERRIQYIRQCPWLINARRGRRIEIGLACIIIVAAHQKSLCAVGKCLHRHSAADLSTTAISPAAIATA
jgi:hypothetical protein